MADIFEEFICTVIKFIVEPIDKHELAILFNCSVE